MQAVDIWSFLPLAVLGAFFIGLSKGGLPAVGMLAVPTLAFRIEPLTAAALLLPIYNISDIYGVWLYRKDYSRRNLAILIPAGVLGVAIGYLVAPYLSSDGAAVAVGAVGIYYCLHTWFFAPKTAERKRARVGPGIVWGALSGLTSFVSHAGAPPYQAYVLPQKLPKLVFAGTTTITFTAVNLAKIPPYVALGQFPRIDVAVVAALVVPAMFGAWTGSKLTRIIPEHAFFVAVRLALFALSVSLVWRGGRALAGL